MTRAALALSLVLSVLALAAPIPASAARRAPLTPEELKQALLWRDVARTHPGVFRDKIEHDPVVRDLMYRWRVPDPVDSTGTIAEIVSEPPWVTRVDARGYPYQVFPYSVKTRGPGGRRARRGVGAAGY